MNHIYHITIDQYLEAVALAKENGKKAGDSIADELAVIFNKYNIVSKGVTELNMDEFQQELESKGKKVITKKDLENEN